MTAAVSVMVSLLVSFTLTPMMSSRMLSADDAAKGHGSGHGQAKSRRGFYALIDRSYDWMLAWSMRHRPTMVVLALLVVAASWPIFHAVPREFVPSDVDEAEFQVSVTAPEGTSMTAMGDVMHTIDDEIRAVPGVRLTLASAGGGFLGQVNTGNVYVRIAPHDERIFSIPRLWHATLAGHPLSAFRGNYSQRDVMEAINARLHKYKDLRTRASPYLSFNVGGGNFDIDFAIRGPDLLELNALGEELLRRTTEMQNAGGMQLDTTLKVTRPELRVNIDRDRAADLGVDARDIGTALRLMVGGDDKVSRFRDPQAGEDYDVELRLEEQDRNRPDLIDRLYLPSKNGGFVQLSNLATVERVQSASRIDRLDRQRQNSVRGAIRAGYAMQDRIDLLRRLAADMNMPPAYSTAVAGRAASWSVPPVSLSGRSRCRSSSCT